ncbi:hypothetical protein CMV_027365 [Castanea mollissima]|uniref:Uncharacterized protein n=1 Tax=Castanea mollissima TaxID=60419 RepID=A0A8J4VF31_9ROSI|nr:hypothetical protein CMV_027365 [Castanea mollissima]
MEEPSSASKNQVMVDGDGGEVKGGEIPRGTEVAGLDSFIGALNRGSYSSNQMMQGWAALKQGIQNEVRTLNFVIEKSFLVFLYGKFHCFEIRLCTNASASRIVFPFSHFFLEEEIHEDSLILDFYDG